MGTCLINGISTKYLCDGGADKTLISESLYKKMKRKNPKIKLDKYDGRIKSCSNEIKIKGTLKLDEFIIDAKDKKLMEEVSVLVSAHISKYEVILGRDVES